MRERSCLDWRTGNDWLDEENVGAGVARRPILRQRWWSHSGRVKAERNRERLTYILLNDWVKRYVNSIRLWHDKSRLEYLWKVATVWVVLNNFTLKYSIDYIKCNYREIFQEQRHPSSCHSLWPFRLFFDGELSSAPNSGPSIIRIWRGQDRDAGHKQKNQVKTFRLVTFEYYNYNIL